MKNIFIFIAVILPVLVFGQSTNQNFVKTTTYRAENSGNPSHSISYFDGLGRPIQQIAHQQSPTGSNIVTHIEYDALGRQKKDFLPLVSGNGMDYQSLTDASIVSYYSSPPFQTLDPTSIPFSEKGFEASPLNRILKQSAPGESWAMGSGHEVKFDYQTNGIDEVRLLKATVTSINNGLYDISFVNSGYYPENRLYKTITKDENWVGGLNNTTEEFKDFDGRVILKRTYADIEPQTEVKHDTYYVYDDFGNLTYVLPPLVDFDEGIGSNVLDNLCYQYKYDHRNRLVEKKLPGKQWEYIVYNSQDMPVATGPAQSPWGENKWGWMITKYDAFGRVVYTGWMESSVDSQKRNQMQSNLGTQWFEAFSTQGSTIDMVAVSYTNNIEPTEFKLLTVNYYDGYGYVNAPQNLPAEIEDQGVLENVKSMATGSWVRVLNDPNNVNAELTYTFYDKKGRAIRSHKTNYLGGYHRIDTKLDFTGKVKYTFTYHKRTANVAEVKVKDMFEYSPQDRLLVHIQKINNKPEELIVKNEYDALGQLITKNVGGSDVINYTGLQRVDYHYNIRGWLKSINNIDQLNDINAANHDLFAFKINYDAPENTIGGVVKALYNGNISETFWRTGTDNIKRKYGYQYDDLNRLTKAIYQRPNNTSQVTNMYDEYLKYDKNGNITRLIRNGDFDSPNYAEAFEIDQLEYEYDSEKKNQLLTVKDLSNSTLGFKDNEINDIDFTYDDNGNLISDANKGISNIKYNHLNLPTQIEFLNGDKIDYFYNAIGQKVLKNVVQGPQFMVTDYLDGFQYRTGKLEFFPHAEGYVSVVGDIPEDYKFFYVYNYTDHLGNIRASYGLDQDSGTLKLMEENHYYPFGLKHTSYNVYKRKYELEGEVGVINPLPLGELQAYNYKYNGKEYQDELGLNMYDYGARNYDPAIGRFTNIDPLIELMRDNSTYSYGFNNPVYFEDFEGLIPLPQIIRSSRTSSGFGIRFHPIRKKMIGHGGVDLVAPVGSDVKSAAIGTIAKIGWDPDGYGNYIIVKHIEGYYTLYGHLSSVNSGLKEGSAVGNGESIASSGNTGGSTGPHLHFEIIKAQSLSGVYNKSNKVNPASIYDLNEMLYPTSNKKFFNGSFSNPRFDFSSMFNFEIPEIKMPFPTASNATSTSNSGSRTPVAPLPTITPRPIVTPGSTLPSSGAVPPTPVPAPVPLPTIPNFLPNVRG